MLKWLRQKRCLHWFDAPTTREIEWTGTVALCCEVQHFRQDEEIRVCSKCGLTDTRRVGEIKYDGWSI